MINLDELVAEHVMRWKRDNGQNWQVMNEHFDTPNATYKMGWLCPSNQLYPHERNHEKLHDTYVESEFTKRAFPKCYSSDANYALEVAQEMRKRGAHIQMGTTSGSKFVWYCEMFGEELISTLPLGDTLPEVICVAALKALGKYPGE